MAVFVIVFVAFVLLLPFVRADGDDVRNDDSSPNYGRSGHTEFELTPPAGHTLNAPRRRFDEHPISDRYRDAALPSPARGDECPCRGMNERCFRCGGTGIIE